MNPLLISLGFISGLTGGALIFLMSLKMLKVGFKPDAFQDKDLGQIVIGIIFLLMGAYVVLFTLIFLFVDLIYLWTLIFSIALIYFLYFYFPKTKFYKSNLKKKRSAKISTKPKDETPSLFTWIQAVTSDVVMFIFVAALLLGFVYLLVKVVKYFWYV